MALLILHPTESCGEKANNLGLNVKGPNFYDKFHGVFALFTNPDAFNIKMYSNQFEDFFQKSVLIISLFHWYFWKKKNENKISLDSKIGKVHL